MSDPAITILSGLVIAFTSGGIGAFIGSYKKVNSSNCDERRKSCQQLLIDKINNVDKKLDSIIDALKSHNIFVI